MNRLHRFAGALRERCGNRRRAELEAHVWPAFVAVYGEAPDGRHPRPTLLEALEELRAEGMIVFPKGGKLFDRTGNPPLPLWVELDGGGEEAESTREAAFNHRAHPWHPALAWVGGLGALRQAEVLLAVDRFLKGSARTAPIVPHRERSLQLFGDEKALDRLLVGNLFGEGRLSPELLRCRRFSPPFVHARPEAVAEAVPAELLVIENHHTWHSFAEWNRAAGRYRAVVYGGGKQFEASVAGIADLAQEVGATRVLYFGDLDPEGIAIPFRASRWQELRGLPAIEAAGELYQALLDAGAGREHGSSGKDRFNPEHLAWLPGDLREPVQALLAAGCRLPQEYIGTEWLKGRGEGEVECPRLG
jgi:hypothetical protein